MPIADYGLYKAPCEECAMESVCKKGLACEAYSEYITGRRTGTLYMDKPRIPDRRTYLQADL